MPALVQDVVESKHETETVTEFSKCCKKPLASFIQNDRGQRRQMKQMSEEK